MTDPRDFWHILPNYVKKDVVHYLDFKTRCNLSYCSKSDLALVKSTPLAFRYITWYPAHPNERSRIYFNTMNCCRDRENTAQFDNVQQIAERLTRMIVAPNTCKLFSFYCESHAEHDEMIELVRELEIQNICLKIKILNWLHTAGDRFDKFLSRIDADYLYGMMVDSGHETSEEVARIVETKQWKNLTVVKIHQSRNIRWWLDSILDKPKIDIGLQRLAADEARRIVEVFQSKNHPAGSCFTVKFYPEYPRAQNVFEDPGERIESDDCTFFLKKFPLADEALELRVQLSLTPGQPDSSMNIDEISGIVTRKDADLEYVDVSEIVGSWFDEE